MEKDDIIFCLGRVCEKVNRNIIFLTAATVIGAAITCKKIKAQDKKIKELSDEIEELKYSKGE